MALLPGLNKKLSALFLFRGPLAAIAEEVADDDLKRIMTLLSLKLVNLHLQGVPDPKNSPKTPWALDLNYDKPDLPKKGRDFFNSSPDQLRANRDSSELWNQRIAKLPGLERYLATIGRKLTFNEYGEPGSNLLQEALWVILQQHDLLSKLSPDPKSALIERLTKLDNTIKFEHARPIIWNKLTMLAEAELLRVFRPEQ